MRVLCKVPLAAIVAVLAMTGLAAASGPGVAQGRVTAVSASAVTVAGANGAVWTFSVTQGARVYGQGASHKTRALESKGKPKTVDNFVREGARVSVHYREQGGTLYLTELRVL